MPAKKSFFGPIAKVFVGPGPMEDENLEEKILKQIIARRTKGGFHSLDIPKQWVACRNMYLESGLGILNFAITFSEGQEDVLKLARGIHISDDTDVDDPPGNALYTVLILGPDKNSKRNYLIPCCQTVNPITDNFEKKVAFSQTVNFAWQGVDPNVKLEHLGTAAELKAILGTRSPI